MKNFMLGIVAGWLACKAAPIVAESALKSIKKIEAETRPT